MKLNTPILIAILFIALSIWLSFSVKSARQEVVHLNSHLKVAEQELQFSKYQKGILQEALELNIGKAPVPTRLTSNHTSYGTGDASLHAILYLKAHACSPCNMPVIEGIINAAAEQQQFQLVSHTSNQHFLQPVLAQNGLAENEKVTWLSHKLYDYHHPVYDAELLFVNTQGLILGVLPLELLKERGLFENWLKGVM